MYKNAIQHDLIWSVNHARFPVTVPIHSHYCYWYGF